MEKLRSMTEYVLDIVQTPNVNEAICFEQTQARLDKIYQYALFLKQPIKLGMFVPCNEDGKVIKKMGDVHPFATNEESTAWDEYITKWEQSKDRILFYKWEVNEEESFKNKEVITISNRNAQLTFFIKTGMVIFENLVIKHSFIVKTIEDLRGCELSFTNGVIK